MVVLICIPLLANDIKHPRPQKPSYVSLLSRQLLVKRTRLFSMGYVYVCVEGSQFLEM